VFIKKLFDSTTVAACGTVLFAFENMHFTQTHLATIDAFVVFFIIAMYLFMYRYISSGYDAPFVKTLPPLFLCGLSFGLGAASKWTGLYAALGLIVLYAAYLVKRGQHQAAAGQKKEYRAFLLQTLAASVGVFVVIPLAIYTLSYFPYATANGQPLTMGCLLGEMLDNQKLMLGFHSTFTAEDIHPYASGWYSWLLGGQPINYYAALQDKGRTVITALTNPLVTIGGLVALGFVLRDCVRKKVKESFIIAVGYLAQVAPWIFVSRYTFLYHYFPAMIFLVLSICYVFKNILECAPERKWRVYAFTGVSAGVFFMLFPLSAGLHMPDWYAAWFVKWLPYWPL